MKLTNILREIIKEEIVFDSKNGKDLKTWLTNKITEKLGEKVDDFFEGKVWLISDNNEDKEYVKINNDLTVSMYKRYNLDSQIKNMEMMRADNNKKLKILLDKAVEQKEHYRFMQ